MNEELLFQSTTRAMITMSKVWICRIQDNFKKVGKKIGNFFGTSL